MTLVPAVFSADLDRVNGARQPEWMRHLREEARARYERLGWPTTRLESWKYTNLAELTRTPFEVANGEPALPAGLEDVRLEGAAVEIVFVNGRFSAELSHRAPGTVGVTVEPLSSALTKLEGRFGTVGNFEGEAFPSLNTALAEDGAFVHLAKGTKASGPVHVLYLGIGGAKPLVVFPRTFLWAEAQSEVTLVETFAGIGVVGRYWTNAVTEAWLGEAASVDYYGVQRESQDAYHYSRLQVHQERDSRFRSIAFSLGGKLARNEIGVRLAAENAECSLDGLFAARGEQHTDTYTTIEHQVPHTASRELYKGILGGKAVGVFNGKIRVEKDAQKTDARQTNKNLLLSTEATINTKPTLEILANDVKCTHGAAIGQIEEEALFYLRSRGIPSAEARGILMRAFAADILAQVRVPALKQKIEKVFFDRWQGTLTGERSEA